MHVLYIVFTYNQTYNTDKSKHRSPIWKDALSVH